MALLEVKNLSISFGGLKAVDNFQISIEKGQLYGLIGPNGAGKTTIFNLLTGVYKPDAGSIELAGVNITGRKTTEINQAGIARTFQNIRLFKDLSVLDNVMFPLNMFSNDTLRERTKRAMFCLERVNLTEAKDKFPGEISGGMQKRVAIARAISLNPQYLFCDEPNSGLDPKTSLVIDDLIHDITQEYNMTTIINTHDMNSVLGIGEKVIYIYEGHKEWEGTKDDIFTSTNERLNNFIFASDLLRKVKDLEVQSMEG